MKIAELRQKSKIELQELLEEKRARLAELSFLLHQKKVKNVKEAMVIKKDIARILTLLRGYHKIPQLEQNKESLNDL